MAFIEEVLPETGSEAVAPSEAKDALPVATPDEVPPASTLADSTPTPAPAPAPAVDDAPPSRSPFEPILPGRHAPRVNVRRSQAAGTFSPVQSAPFGERDPGAGAVEFELQEATSAFTVGYRNPRIRRPLVRKQTGVTPIVVPAVEVGGEGEVKEVASETKEGKDDKKEDAVAEEAENSKDATSIPTSPANGVVPEEESKPAVEEVPFKTASEGPLSPPSSPIQGVPTSFASLSISDSNFIDTATGTSDATPPPSLAIATDPSSAETVERAEPEPAPSSPPSLSAKSPAAGKEVWIEHSSSSDVAEKGEEVAAKAEEEGKDEVEVEEGKEIQA